MPDPQLTSYAPSLKDIRRFWRKVLRGSDSECWSWTGPTNGKGYGRFGIYRDGKAKHFYAHRLSFEILVGPIADGLTLDHKCRNRSCCNPDHLEPVTSRENTLRGAGISARHARQTHCLHGHELSGDNLIVIKGKRRCRACRYEPNGRKAGYFKITAEDVLRIVARVKAGEKQNAVAADYGLDPSSVNNIMSGKRWPKVTAGLL